MLCNIGIRYIVGFTEDINVLGKMLHHVTFILLFYRDKLSFIYCHFDNILGYRIIRNGI